MPRVPEWRDEPEQVWITCQEMRDLPQLDEFLVLFKVNGEQFTSFVPKRSSTATRWLYVERL